jgi:hypothetical protein
VAISTATNGRALQSKSWWATTDSIFISQLPLRDYTRHSFDSPNINGDRAFDGTPPAFGVEWPAFSASAVVATVTQKL